MSRAFLVVLDSVGCGGAPDAAEFGDEGSNTLGHIHEAVGLKMPNLVRLGLGQAVTMSTGAAFPSAAPQGLYGVAREVSPGKDTPTGHWEMSGVPVPWAWHYFPTAPSFPSEIVEKICEFCGTDDILGNEHASGTEVIERLGEVHLKTGQPICYTSVDSVFQIAAHETHFGLDRLLGLCRHIAPMLHKMKVGRVIARPFLGEDAQSFKRTKNRRDFAVEVPAPTLLDWAHEAGRKTYAIGKISDIFSGRGIDHSDKGTDAELMEALAARVEDAEEGSLTFANFVEFDTKYGHRRDAPGYAGHLEWFDAQIGAVLANLRPGDLMLFTADHGNDPTWRGTDHTREQVPVIGAGLGMRDIGQVGFVDIAASVADHLGLETRGPGRSFL